MLRTATSTREENPSGEPTITGAAAASTLRTLDRIRRERALDDDGRTIILDQDFLSHFSGEPKPPTADPDRLTDDPPDNVDDAATTNPGEVESGDSILKLQEYLHLVITQRTIFNERLTKQLSVKLDDLFSEDPQKASLAAAFLMYHFIEKTLTEDDQFTLINSKIEEYQESENPSLQARSHCLRALKLVTYERDKVLEGIGLLNEHKDIVPWAGTTIVRLDLRKYHTISSTERKSLLSAAESAGDLEASFIIKMLRAEEPIPVEDPSSLPSREQFSLGVFYKKQAIALKASDPEQAQILLLKAAECFKLSVAQCYIKASNALYHLYADNPELGEDHLSALIEAAICNEPLSMFQVSKQLIGILSEVKSPILCRDADMIVDWFITAKNVISSSTSSSINKSIKVTISRYPALAYCLRVWRLDYRVDELAKIPLILLSMLKEIKSQTSIKCFFQKLMGFPLRGDGLAEKCLADYYYYSKKNMNAIYWHHFSLIQTEPTLFATRIDLDSAAEAAIFSKFKWPSDNPSLREAYRCILLLNTDPTRTDLEEKLSSLAILSQVIGFLYLDFLYYPTVISNTPFIFFEAIKIIDGVPTSTLHKSLALQTAFYIQRGNRENVLKIQLIETIIEFLESTPSEEVTETDKELLQLATTTLKDHIINISYDDDYDNNLKRANSAKQKLVQLGTAYGVPVSFIELESTLSAEALRSLEAAASAAVATTSGGGGEGGAGAGGDQGRFTLPAAASTTASVADPDPSSNILTPAAATGAGSGGVGGGAGRDRFGIFPAAASTTASVANPDPEAQRLKR